MANPCDVLGVTLADGDETIRQHYLEAVRRSPPERCPDEFKRVRDAYERIKDVRSRLEFLLFDPSQGEALEDLLEEEKCRSAPRRMGLAALLSLLDRAR